MTAVDNSLAWRLEITSARTSEGSMINRSETAAQLGRWTSHESESRVKYKVIMNPWPWSDLTFDDRNRYLDLSRNGTNQFWTGRKETWERLAFDRFNWFYCPVPIDATFAGSKWTNKYISIAFLVMSATGLLLGSRPSSPETRWNDQEEHHLSSSHTEECNNYSYWP